MAQEPKRVYETPELLKLGDVTELTQNIGSKGNLDGGGGGAAGPKTSA
jgi:hypothetical protein